MQDRQSTRLKGYDYTHPGEYFVTICTQDRETLFGDVVGGQMHKNDSGEMIHRVWYELPKRFPGMSADAFIVMPNHVHAVLGLSRNETAHDSLGAIVGGFKSITTGEYITGVRLRGWRPFRRRLWQRNYYEHVIRTDEGLERIREYICTNPARWTEDPENPVRALGDVDDLDEILDFDLQGEL